MEGVSVSVKLWFLVLCVQCEVLCRLVVAGNVFLLMLIVVIFMLGDRSILLCVVCFISGLVIRCVVSVH